MLNSCNSLNCCMHFRRPGGANPVGLALAVAFLAFLIPASSASAWVITQIDPAASLAAATVYPFRATSTYAKFEIDDYFLPGYNQDVDGGLVLQFTRQAGDPNTIQIVQAILNMTDANWDGYHVAISNNPFRSASFVKPQGAWAGETNGGAARLGGSPDSLTTSGVQIDWSDSWGAVPTPAEEVPAGSIYSGPTNQLVLTGITIDVSKLKVGDTFSIVEWPNMEWQTVPEPCTLALLSAGLVGVLLRRRRRL